MDVVVFLFEEKRSTPTSSTRLSYLVISCYKPTGHVHGAHGNCTPCHSPRPCSPCLCPPGAPGCALQCDVPLASASAAMISLWPQSGFRRTRCFQRCSTTSSAITITISLVGVGLLDARILKVVLRSRDVDAPSHCCSYLDYVPDIFHFLRLVRCDHLHHKFHSASPLKSCDQVEKLAKQPLDRIVITCQIVDARGGVLRQFDELACICGVVLGWCERPALPLNSTWSDVRRCVRG